MSEERGVSDIPGGGTGGPVVPKLNAVPSFPTAAAENINHGTVESLDHVNNTAIVGSATGYREIAVARFSANSLSREALVEPRAKLVKIGIGRSADQYTDVKFDLLSADVLTKLRELNPQRAEEIKANEALQKELGTMFAGLLVMIETPVEGDAARLPQMKAQIIEKLLGQKPTEEESKIFNLALDSALVSIKKVKVVEKLSELAAQKPELAEKINQANLEIEELQKALDEKKITPEDAMKRFDEILKRAVEESGDEELKKMLEEQRKEEEKQKEKEKEFEQGGGYYGEASYETREEAQGAVYDTMSGAGFTVNINPENGLMEVTMPDANGNFNFAVRLEKDDNGKFVYVVEDKYSNKGEKGPYKAEELLRAADQRHIDAYLSYKLRPLIKAPDNANAVKDEELIKVGEKIIGGGEVRQYRIDGDYRRGLDGLVKLLAAEDKEEPQLEMKVHKLALYLDRLDVGECRSLMNRFKDNVDGLNVSKVIKGEI